MHAYQTGMSRFIVDNPRCAPWMDQGLGKTITTLTAVADVLAEYDAMHVLVVAPRRVCLTVWPQEVDAWEHTCHLSVRQLAGLTPAKRLKALAEPTADITVINVELLPWLVKTMARKWRWDWVVIDEATMVKNPNGKRFRAARRVADMLGVTRITELTGTPATKGLLDLWAQVRLLDGGDRLERRYTWYRRKHFESDYMEFNWWPKKGAEQKIRGAVADICQSLSAEDYLDMPPLVVTDLVVKMPPKARKVYDDLGKHFLAEIADAEISAVNEAALVGKLLQCANGAVYEEDEITGERSTHLIHDEKLNALESVVEEAAGEPVLVAYQFLSDIERIQKRFPQAVLLDKDGSQVDPWNRGEIPMLLCHPKSAGHGLNLQKGGRIIAMFGLNWSLELYLQFIARLWRQGQTRPVLVRRIVADDTADFDVIATLNSDNTNQRALLDAVKSRIERRAA